MISPRLVMRFRLLIPLLPIWPSIILAQQEAFYLLFIFNIIAVEKYETPIFYCLLQHTQPFLSVPAHKRDENFARQNIFSHCEIATVRRLCTRDGKLNNKNIISKFMLSEFHLIKINEFHKKIISCFGSK